MCNKKTFVLFSLLFFVGLFSLNLNASFPAGTVILTPAGGQLIETLVANLDKPITSLNPLDGTISKTKINCMRVGFECKLIRITTDQGSLVVGKKQKLFAGNRDQFVPAEDLNPGDVLSSKNVGNCICLYFEEVGSCGNTYEIVLERPNGYFVSDLRLLAIR